MWSLSVFGVKSMKSESIKQTFVSEEFRKSKYKKNFQEYYMNTVLLSASLIHDVNDNNIKNDKTYCKYNSTLSTILCYFILHCI